MCSYAVRDYPGPVSCCRVRDLLYHGFPVLSPAATGGHVQKSAFWEKIALCLHRMISRHPLLVVVVALALAAVSFLYTWSHFNFWTERSVLISQKSPSAMRYHDYRQEFPDDYLIIVLSSRDVEEAKRFAAKLGQRLENDPVPVREVFYRIPPETFQRQALLFLNLTRSGIYRERSRSTGTCSCSWRNPRAWSPCLR